ncbi:MAG: amidophosphoribosyltransferase [Clostridiales bacterium]|nr:amidophosphoribosyltransferase [Clostridiales bacterium]
MMGANSMKEKCGVYGIYNNGDVAMGSTAYLALFSMQHRGQDGAGVASTDGKTVRYHKELGLVSEVFDEQILKQFDKQKIAVGHVRYGNGHQAHESLCVEPIVLHSRDGFLAICHNGNIINSAALSQSLRDRGVLLHSGVDSEILLHLIARRMEVGLEQAIVGMMQVVHGSYALTIMSRDKVVGVRDPYGIRPLCLGKLGNSYMLASESCAFDAVGGTFIRDVQPGEIVTIDAEGVHSTFGKSESEKLCVFEYVYYARADSLMGGVGVYGARYRAGQLLAKCCPVEADMVAGVPESALPSAIGYADASGIPYGQALLKNPYVGRTFIQPSQAAREKSVSLKLTPLAETVRGKRIVLVDDSIVRGTTTIKLVESLRRAGAKEVHMRISSPPVCFPCHFGINTPNPNQLIGNKMQIEDLRKLLGADTLEYLDLEMLKQSVYDENGNGPKGLCTACFDGDYPVDLKLRKQGC